MEAVMRDAIEGSAMDDAKQVIERLVGLRGAAYQLAARLLAGRDGAEDVVQQAYLAAIRSLRNSPPPDDERAWFLKTVVNSAKTFLRSEASRDRRETAVQIRSEVQAGRDAELVEHLRLSMNALDEEHRIPIALCCEQGLSHREAAVVLDLPKTTLTRRVEEGLEELRKSLAKAGYAAVPAAITGALAHTAPPVPATLAAAVENLISNGVGAGLRPAPATETAVASAATKGGLLVKIGLGVAAAGLVAGGVFWAVGGKAEDKPAAAAAAPAERKAPEPDQKYKWEPVVGARNPGRGGSYYLWRFGNEGLLDGPGIGACAVDCDDLACDAAGNCYWTEPGHFNVLRTWRRSDGLVRPVAGAASGFFDGPLESARFGYRSGGGYEPSAIVASADGKHFFLRDSQNNYAIRHVDLETGLVSTMGHRLIFAKDASGDIYVLDPKGGNVPAGKGFKTLQVPKLEEEGENWDGWKALDVSKGRLYGHNRGAVSYWDLKTGKRIWITSKDLKDPKRHGWETTGPIATVAFWCPIGLNISPGGRFLYLGGGDATTVHRLDLEKDETRNLAPNPDGTCSWNEVKGKWTPVFADWPACIDFAADGTIYWGTPTGIFSLTPVK